MDPRSLNLSPQIAELLYGQGKISKDTLDASIAAASPSSMPSVGGSGLSATPTNPTANDPFSLFGGQKGPSLPTLGGASIAAPSTDDAIMSNAPPPGKPGPTSTPDPRALPAGIKAEGGITLAPKRGGGAGGGGGAPAGDPELAHADTDQEAAAEGSGVPRSQSGASWAKAQDRAANPPKKNADETYYDELKGSYERRTDTDIDRKLAEQEQHEAYAKGQEQAALQINNTIADQQDQIKRDTEYKQQSMAKAQAADDVAKQRAKELSESKVDRSRWWKSMSGGSQVLSGLALMASGLASGATGKNPVMDQWNKRIDDDVHDQTQELQNKKEGWEMEQNAAAREFARDNDWLGYRSSKRMEGLNLLRQQVDATMMDSKSAEARAAGKKAVADIDSHIEQERMGLATHRYQLDKQKEQAAAAASAAQAARVQKIRTDTMADTKELMKEKGLSFEDAYRNAYAMNTGINLGGTELPKIPTKEELANKYKETKEDKEKDRDSRAYGVHVPFLQNSYKSLTADQPGDVTSKTFILPNVPGTDAKKYDQKLEQYNAQVNTILGHWLKVESGRVPVGEFQGIVHRFEINPGMTADEKRARIAGLKAWVDERAKTSGVYNGSDSSAPAPGTAIPEGVPATVRK